MGYAMIQIDISKKLGDIRKIYLRARLNSKTSLVKAVTKKIENHIGKQYATNAERIAGEFLTKWFVKNGKFEEDALIEYLLSSDLERIILSFWQCVGSVWSRHAGKTFPQNVDSSMLMSQWYGAKNESLKLLENNDPNASAPVKDIIDKVNQSGSCIISMIPAGSQANRPVTDTDLSSEDHLHRVTFDLYGDIGKIYAPGKAEKDHTKGALDILEGIFAYDTLSGGPRTWILNAMNVTVCPYCNRQYITSLTADGKDINTGDIDHFYLKNVYPYLALSVYNFIPSCQICNSRFKHTEDCFYTPHVNPHKHGFGSRARFRIPDITPYLDEDAWNNSDNLLVIEVDRRPAPPASDEPSPEAIENSIATFHLNEVYASHYDYAREIVWKSRIYTDDMIDSLSENLGSIFGSKKEIRELVYGQYLNQDEAHKRPFAKLTQDLLEESTSWVIPQKSSK